MSRKGVFQKIEHANHKQYYPAAGCVEHDAHEIWRHTQKLILKICKDLKTQPVALALANPGETVLLWNRKTGQALHRALVWQDARTQNQMQDWAQNPSLEKEIGDRTGLKLDAYFSASKIRWLLDHAPGARKLLEQKHLCAGTIDSWLIWNLTQGRSFVTDSSTAARTLLYNIHELKYDPYLLDLFGIPETLLPEVLPSCGKSFGTLKGISQKLDGIPIVASLVDQPAALYGNNCLTPGDVKATYGTGCFIYANCGSQAPHVLPELLSTIAWQKGEKLTYALDGGVLSVGSVMTWLQKQIHLIKDGTKLDHYTQVCKNSGSVLFVPALHGLGAPFWNRSARGAWLGLGLETTKEQMILAVLEGVAGRVAQVIESIQQKTGLKIKSLKVDGGLTRSRHLMQIQADFLGIPLEVSEEAEATLLGACQLAAQELGFAEKNKRKSVRKVFKPQLSETERKEKLKKFEKALKAVQEFHS